MLGLSMLSRVVGEVRRDVAAAHARDPAARGATSSEILASWPGVHALLSHRVAHGLHDLGVPVVPRTLSMAARTVTGIEIHPAATSATASSSTTAPGVVVGETAEIGDDVTLYQGVTLGGTGFATGKRHPTLEDNVTVGSGAKLLGPITDRPRREDRRELRRHPRRPAELDRRRQPRPSGARRGRKPEGPDADWVHLPDPIADAMKDLSRRIAALERARRPRATSPARGATSARCARCAGRTPPAADAQ